MSSLVTQTLFDALLLIGLYAIGSLGFSLIWGVLNVLNLTYAAFITFGGYATYSLWHAGVDPLLALPVTMALTFVLGWVIQRVALIRCLMGRRRLASP